MFTLVIPILLALLMVYVMYSDLTRYIIPNWLNASIVALYVHWVFVAPVAVDWPMGLLMAAVYFAGSFLLFALGIIGAGDAKLMTVLGLFLGWNIISLEFLINMSLLGGVMAVVIVATRRVLKYQNSKYRVFRPKEPAPYGIAIAGAFLITLAYGKLAGMQGLIV